MEIPGHFSVAINTLAPGGYLAVDFFFVLSGFVLSVSYTERFNAGLSASRFLLLRVIRLYPIYLAGVVLGLAYAIQGTLRASENHVPMSEITSALVPNLMMLPWPIGKYLVSLNSPAWSLVLELAANVALALFLWKWTRKRLIIVGAAAGALLVVVTIAFQTTDPGHDLIAQHVSTMAGGATWAELPVGLARVTFSFILGMALATLPRPKNRQPATLSLLVVAALVVVLMVPLPAEKRLPYDIVVVLLASPILVWLGSRVEPPPALFIPAAFLGEVSYALYSIHMPISHAFQLIGRMANIGTPWLAPGYLAVCIVIASVLTVAIDKPMRGALRKMIDRPEPDAVR